TRSMMESSRASCPSRSAYRRARTKSRLPAPNRQTISSSTAACHSVSRARTLSGAIAVAQEETHAANGVQQLAVERLVDLAPQARDGDVDDVVERRGARRHLPHIARQHLAGHGTVAVAREVLEHVELLRRQLERPAATRDFMREQIDLQVVA